MLSFELPALLRFLFGLGLDVVLIIVGTVAASCYLYDLLCRCREGGADDHDGDDRRHQEGAAAAAAASHAPQPAPEAAAVQMAAMAAVTVLDHVTYPRHQTGGGDGHPSEEEECAICLGQLEDGDLCSVMPGCRHEFHRSCVARWLTACSNTCPLCRAQPQWDVVAHGMV